MATENELKFLVSPTWRDKLGDAIIENIFDIKQGYLLNTPEKVVRVRLNGSTGQAFITIKGQRVGASCPEFEYAIPWMDGVQLIGMCDAVIEKKRHVIVTEQYQTWEVDVFSGLNEGLVMAEIEYDNEPPCFVPEWVQDEVTTDVRYTNARLIYDKAPCLAVS